MKPAHSSNRITRRKAIGSGLVVASGVALGSGVPAVADDLLSTRSETSLAYMLSEDYWANMVGETFRLLRFSFNDRAGTAKRTRLVLSETSLLIPAGIDHDRPDHLQPFAISLLFEGSRRFALVAASYTLHHPWLGEFDLMLSHFRQKQRFAPANMYEAIINN